MLVCCTVPGSDLLDDLYQGTANSQTGLEFRMLVLKEEGNLENTKKNLQIKETGLFKCIAHSVWRTEEGS